MTFDCKVRRVQSDLKEPKDGSDRVVTLVVLSTEAAEEIVAQLLGLQHAGACRVTVETIQAELPLDGAQPVG